MNAAANVRNGNLRVLVVSAGVGRSPCEVASSFVFDEVVRLARRGLEVHVARLKFEGDARAYGVFFHDARRIGILTSPLKLSRLAHYPLGAFPRAPASLCVELLYSDHVARLAKELKPSLLHAHFAYPEGWAACLARAVLKSAIPLVVTLHGYDILVEPSVGYGIRLNKRYDVLVRKVLNEADAIIAASRAVLNEAARLVSDPEKVRLIPNGVDLRRFDPKLSGEAVRKKLNLEGEQVVFTLRHHRPVYGITHLLLAAKLVLRERKDAIFVVGGDGPLLNYHRELAGKLGISSNVVFTGKIPRDEVPHYYAASDVVVVPSLQEAWGLVATEAMACGKPGVASRVGGLPDQVIDGFNGFLVPPRDPKALADRILYLLETPSEARRMGLNGRKLAVECFDIEKRIDKIVRLYRELVEGEKSAV